MAFAGLSEKGFKIKKMADIKSDMENELRSKVDPTLSFEASTVAGSLTAIVANQAAQVWESLAALYHALQPNTATGFSLDALCSLTGTYRKKGSFSQAQAEVFLKPNTKIPAGHAVKTTGGHIFKLKEEVVNNLPNEAPIKAVFIAQEKGPLRAHAQTDGEIMNSVSGWLKTIFLETTHVGQFDETDEELRIRRISELKATGVSTTDALRARLKELPNVEGVYIKEGAQSFEAFIKGGEEQAIAQTIWRCRPVGIQTLGNIIVDIESTRHTISGERTAIRFSRPKSLDLALSMTIKLKTLLPKNSSEKEKSNETERIKKNLANILTEFATKHFSMGAEVYKARFYGTILNHPQVLDVINLDIKCKDGTALPSLIPPDQIACLKFSDISTVCIEAA